MANQIIIPDLNPIEWYEMTPAEVPQYISRPYGKYPFRTQNASRPWLNQVVYKQKWQTSDVTYLQFQSNFEPIRLDVIDCYDIARITQNSLQKRINKFLPGFYVYENTVSWATIIPGTYWMKLVLPDRVMISEPIEVKVTHPGTVLIEYRHSRYHENVIFETGIKFGFRVEGTIGFLKPGTVSTFYKDQKYNPYLLSSKKFRGWPFNIGGTRGNPDWVFDKITGIWTCNDVTIDGISYARTTDDDLEFKTEDRYLLRGAVMNIEEGINRGSKIVGVNVDPTKKLLVVYQIDGTVWGDTSSQAGSNLVPIISSE